MRALGPHRYRLWSVTAGASNRRGAAAKHCLLRVGRPGASAFKKFLLSRSRAYLTFDLRRQVFTVAQNDGSFETAVTSLFEELISSSWMSWRCLSLPVFW